MKKGAIVALIIAGVLILSGGILIFWGLQSVHFDFSQEAATKTYVVNDPFQSIEIDSDTCDVVLVKTDGEFRAICPDSEKLSCAVIVEDGVLKISAVDIRHWTDMISVFHPEMRVTVYLPESQYQTLRIETDTGDIAVPEEFSFETANVFSSTGDIDFAAAVAQSLIVSNATGDIHVRDTSPALMDVRLSTGDILLEDLSGCGDIRLRSSTGAIIAVNVTCANLTCGSSTGDIHLTGVLTEESLQITATTGDVIIESSDAGFVTIETDTGDVTGHFLSPKYFVTETDTGNVDVPHTRDGGECLVTTDTGDITFY